MSSNKLRLIQKNFLQELTSAYTGKKTSLAFLRNPLSNSPVVKDGEIFQVISIGGSITRIALMKKRGKQLDLIGQKERKQPVFHTKEDFLSFIDRDIDEKVAAIAINFAYPLEPVLINGLLDGIFLYGTKEHEFRGLAEKHIGKEIEMHIGNTQKRSVKVSVANDTICLLLSGLIKYQKDELVCFVLGTGYNAAFFLDDQTAINLEAGNFNKFPFLDTTKIIDKTSAKPGVNVFEKEIAGGYLFQHFNLLARKKHLLFPPLSSTADLDAIARNGKKETALAQNILSHAAELVACQIAGIAQFKKRNLICVAEGSLFWNGWNFKEHVELTVKKLAPGYSISFTHIEHSPLIGAAQLIV